MANTNELVDNGSYYEVLLSDGKTYRVNKEYYSGTYTPTVTGITNVSATTAYTCQYVYVKGMVTVSGYCDVDPAAAALTVVYISLPVISDIMAIENLAGVAFTNLIQQGAAIRGNVPNDTAEMAYLSVDGTNRGMYFTFTYQIL